MLAALGLDGPTERIYTDLVLHGPATAAELAVRCPAQAPPSVAASASALAALPAPPASPVPLSPHVVHSSLAALEALGLVAPAADGSGRYTAAPPSVALEALLTGRRHALHQAELTASMLADAYRAAAAGDTAHRDLVEVVSGRAAISHRVAQLQAGATEELLALVTGRHQVVPADATGAETDAVERGVRYRVVLERQALDEPGAAGLLFEALDRRQRIRVVDRVPTKLIIADRGRALLPLSDGPEPAVLLVRAPALVAVLTVLFEQTWEWAHPLGREGGSLRVGEAAAGEPDDLDRRILALLLSGATDQAVAKQLGLGLRTVQRRISGLMALARADTRIQLGWQAHRRGWITS